MQKILLALATCLMLFSGCVMVDDLIRGGSDDASWPQDGSVGPKPEKNDSNVNIPADDLGETANENPDDGPVAIEGDGTVQTEPEPEPEPESGACTIKFHKDASNIYLIVVETESEKEVTVKCPNGDVAEKKGSFFFCTELNAPSPVVAYVGGAECASQNFAGEGGSAEIQSDVKCTIFVSDPRITMGETTEITVQTSTGDQQIELSYTCGAGEKTQTRSGFVRDGAICRFDVPGTVEIVAKADGEVCATGTLEVFEKAKDCTVQSGKFKHQVISGKHVYTASVSARGYSGSDDLKYTCYDVPNNVALRKLADPTDFTYEIKCEGNGVLEESVAVKVGGDLCGEISP